MCDEVKKYTLRSKQCQTLLACLHISNLIVDCSGHLIRGDVQVADQRLPRSGGEDRLPPGPGRGLARHQRGQHTGPHQAPHCLLTA